MCRFLSRISAQTRRKIAGGLSPVKIFRRSMSKIMPKRCALALVSTPPNSICFRSWCRNLQQDQWLLRTECRILHSANLAAERQAGFLRQLWRLAAECLRRRANMNCFRSWCRNLRQDQWLLRTEYRFLQVENLAEERQAELLRPFR